MGRLWCMLVITSHTRACWPWVTARSPDKIYDMPSLCDGADLLIHDAQYTAEEYPEKVGWGHSPVEYVVKLAAVRAREKGCAHSPRSAQGR